MKNALQHKATHRGFCTGFGKKWALSGYFFVKE